MRAAKIRNTAIGGAAVRPVINLQRIGDRAISFAEQWADVPGGRIYLYGSVVVAQWECDALGRPLTVKQGRETWALPDTAWGRQQAADNFRRMVERWQVEESSEIDAAAEREIARKDAYSRCVADAGDRW